MGTNCAPLVADLFLFCMRSRGTLLCIFLVSRLILLMFLTLHPDICTFFLNINNVYFDNMVS